MITQDERAEMQMDLEAMHNLRRYVSTIYKKIEADFAEGTISEHIAETLRNGLADLKTHSPDGKKVEEWKGKCQQDQSYADAYGEISNKLV